MAFWGQFASAELPHHNRCLQQSEVYNLHQIETTMFIADRVCGQSGATMSCTAVIRALVLALSDSRIQL